MARPDARVPVALFRPFERFFRLESAGSIVLLGAAVVALAWANSPLASAYESLWATKFVIGAGAFRLEKALLLWVNDGLMAIFFFLVGLEIKRELLRGELSSFRAALLPVAAAVGGMVAPALIYVALNWGTPEIRGWGVPMATDIAFALGALAVLGRRLPTSLRIFLAAAAIVDDLGAVLVIALFYTPHVSLLALGVAALTFLALVALNRGGVRSPGVYVLLGVVLWVAVLKSGVHATIAGVLLALTIPSTDAPGSRAFIERAREMLGRAEAARIEGADESSRDAAMLALEKAAESQEAPLTRMEHALVPYVTFGIMPIFALANAGVRLEGTLGDALGTRLSLGIILGLVIGKQIGMTLIPALVVRMGLATMPAGATLRHLYGVSWLAGIGFTMSLFIAGLAFPPEQLATSKIAILAASTIAAVGGLAILATAPRKDTARP